jgi:hypothetical protein
VTAAGGRRPAIAAAIGIPDGMSVEEAQQRFGAGRLQGVSAISKALLPWLRQEGHSVNTVVFGSSGALNAASARALHERTGGDVLVNLICEPGLQRLALRQLAGYELATQLPAINPSRVVVDTTRPAIARRLAHQAGVRAPHCTLYRAGPLTLPEHVQAHGHRYPVLLRPPGQHGSVGLVRAEDPDEAAARAGGLASCTVTDFVDFRSPDELWRKYRMIYAGGRLFRRHVLIDRHWNLTRDARDFMDDHPELIAEEQAWIQRPVTLEAGSIEARAMHQFRALQLDFGVIDCGLPADGDLVVFEINACVGLTNRVDRQAVADPRYFEANNDDILDALCREICARATTA